MSQPKRRSRKCKLVPRCAEPEIEEVIETENEEQQIKIMNTMSLATCQPQPGPSKVGSGSIQFKVDIEVEEWIDDELIEENFAKMQSERLSEALDKEIAEEADWNNDEYGKIWAEAASDSEDEEKPLNEYEKLIKNQIDPSILAGPKDQKDKMEESCDPKKEKSKAKKKTAAKKSKTSKKKIETMTNIDTKQLDEELNKINSAPAPPIRQYKRPGPKSKTQPQVKINITYSEESPTSYNIDLHTQPSIDLPADSLENQKKKSTITREFPYISENGTVLEETKDTENEQNLQVLIIPPDWLKHVAINDMEEFGKSQNSDFGKLEKSQNSISNSENSVDLVQLTVDEDEILGESERIVDTVHNAEVKDELDIKCTRMLHIELQNRIGNTGFVRHEFTKEEALIDFALRQWSHWQGQTKVRSLPLSYKCYICCQGWWHLDPFQTHLKEHERVQLSLEKLDHECNIIAHTGKPDNSKKITIEGDCWKCGEGQDSHLSDKKRIYICEGCKTQLSTCVTLAEHRGLCLALWKKQIEQQKTKDIKAYKCKICPQIFFTEDMLHNHQYYCHVPRSDYPVLVRLNQCAKCNQYFHIQKFHFCSFKIQKYRCKFCLRHFPSTYLCKVHISNMRSNVQCQFCSETVERECMMAKHLLCHNDRYMMAYKCLMCFGKHVFLEDMMMVTRHADFVHKSTKYVRSLWCYMQVLLPRSLYETKKVVTKQARSGALQKIIESSKENPIEVETEMETEITTPAGTEPETAAVKVKNEMENYFEEDSSQMDSDTEFKPLIIDTSSIKMEINDDFEGTEVNAADLMDITQTEVKAKTEMDTQTEIDTAIVKQEKQDTDNVYLDTSQNISQKDVSLSDINKFSEKLQTFLENMDEEQEATKNSSTCTVCKFEGNKTEYKIHLKTCPSKARKKIEERICTKCDKSFKSMKEYVRHLPKHGFPRCKCTECDREFPNLSSWILHINMHVKRSFTIVKLLSTKPVWRCKTCKEMVKLSAFFQHWESHLALPKKKNNVNTRPVLKQDSNIITTELLQQITKIFDMTTIELIPKNCIVCGRFFGRMSERKRHLVEHLLDAANEAVLRNGGLVCQICGHKSLKPDYFRRHMRDHAGLPLYHCELCNKTFSDSSNFVKHKKVHNMEAYLCDVCNKKFVAKASLEAHIASHRSDPLRCSRCPDKLFYSESAYRKHVRSAHDKSSGKTCPYCRQRFLTIKEKWDHQWEVHKLRNRIADCLICGMKFRKAADVKNHIYTVHMEKNRRRTKNMIPANSGLSEIIHL